MRKYLENGLLMLSYIFGLLSVIITTIVTYDLVDYGDLHNGLMRTLIFIISFTFIAAAVGYAYMNFSSSKAVNEILIYQSECSRTKVTKKVIRRLIGQAVAGESFVKINRIKLVVVDGTLHFIVFISLTESNVPYYVDYLKALIADVMDHTLKLANYRTDFKIKRLNTPYEVPRGEIMKGVEAQYEKEEKVRAAERETSHDNITGKDTDANKTKIENSSHEKEKEEDKQENKQIDKKDEEQKEQESSQEAGKENKEEHSKELNDKQDGKQQEEDNSKEVE